MADTKELRFYKHQDNAINSKFMKIANMHFKIASITSISSVNKHYATGRYSNSNSDKEEGYFEFISDGLPYKIITDIEMCNKIHEKMVQWIFPSQDKVYI